MYMVDDTFKVIELKYVKSKGSQHKQKNRRKNVANTKKRQSRNAVNINITQMMVGKQRVKR